jgi:hypothetical protein
VVVQEPQRGTNCQLSASTGLPAMAMPAGFTEDGVPVGMELMGPAWSDAKLLSMAYSYERVVKPRRVPPTTPALIGGKTPPPLTFTLVPDGQPGSSQVRVVLRYDRTAGRLHYEWQGMAAGDSMLAAAIHRGAPGSDGPTIVRLANPAAPATTGEVELSPHQRTWLEEGRLVISMRTAGEPDRRLTVPLRLPR